MQSEKQYIDLYTEAQQIIKDHAAPVMNEVRDKAFDDFRRLGFPSKKVERYKYTTIDHQVNIRTEDIYYLHRTVKLHILRHIDKESVLC